MARRSRTERLDRVRGKRRRLYVVASAVSAVALGAIVLALVLAGVDAGAEPAAAELEADTIGMLAADETTVSIDASETAQGLIEVPDVTGSPIEEAELLLGVAGFEVVRVSTPPGDVASGTVLAQAPQAGERVLTGSAIELVWADPTATATGTTLTGQRSYGRAPVVCIDPGHQERANTSPEPIGPGASETKAKVTGGGTGVVTKQSEYRLVLAISLKLKERLEARGVTVVMTRSTDAVDISNSQRAKVASDAGADLFVRVHADSSTNADIRGISTLYPSGNDWVAPIETRSLAAAKAIHSAVLVSTGAGDRGLARRADLSGFNWSTVPAVLVETGYLSNPVDDRALADPSYQNTIADGIAAGIFAYLGM
ncbi:MAG: N-acetylmuramoyl-L-alanine amidase [Coriobacteriia bacterium]|nr:N-acetylmuramoyl-L-alanine amidase [Coriobacteriia bacterium]